MAALTGLARVLVVDGLRAVLRAALRRVVAVAAGAQPELPGEHSPRGQQPQEHPRGQRPQPHPPPPEGSAGVRGSALHSEADRAQVPADIRAPPGLKGGSCLSPERGRRQGAARAGKEPGPPGGGGRARSRSGAGAPGQAVLRRPGSRGSAAPGARSRSLAPGSAAPAPSLPGPCGAAPAARRSGKRVRPVHQHRGAESGPRGRARGAGMSASPEAAGPKRRPRGEHRRGRRMRRAPSPACLFTLFLT